jgi:hypothetical protein
MARHQQFFFLEALPDLARDTLFHALTYNTAAVACCVSRAWNRQFATHARHLWAELVFDTCHLDGPITDAVVRGVAAKARDALTRITLPKTLLYGSRGEAGCASSTVPALCAAHPALAHVVLPEADLGVVRDVLASSAALVCVEVDRLCINADEVTDGHALLVLTNPALRVGRLDVHQHATQEDTLVHGGGTASWVLSAAAAAMQAQAAWLEEVRVSCDAVVEYGGPFGVSVARAGEESSDGAPAFVAAVAACRRLAKVNAPGMLTASAFSSVMAALAVHDNFAAEGVNVETGDPEHYLPAVVQHLLPRLACLSVAGPGNRYSYNLNEDINAAHNAAMCDLAAHLSSAPALRYLSVTGGESLSFTACRQLFIAVASSASVTELKVRRATAEQLNMLANIGMPAGLTSLTIVGLVTSPELAPALGMLLDAAAHVDSLSFKDCSWDREDFWALASHLATAQHSRVRRLTLTNVDWMLVPGAWGPLASALWVNSTLEELTVSPMHDACASALADGIRLSRGLKVFTAGVALADSMQIFDEDPPPARRRLAQPARHGRAGRRLPLEPLTAQPERGGKRGAARARLLRGERPPARRAGQAGCAGDRQARRRGARVVGGRATAVTRETHVNYCTAQCACLSRPEPGQPPRSRHAAAATRQPPVAPARARRATPRALPAHARLKLRP